VGFGEPEAELRAPVHVVDAVHAEAPHRLAVHRDGEVHVAVLCARALLVPLLFLLVGERRASAGGPPDGGVVHGVREEREVVLADRTQVDAVAGQVRAAGHIRQLATRGLRVRVV
jgi:hypothetical protein